jgi:RNA polymerase sigma-32 factor
MAKKTALKAKKKPVSKAGASKSPKKPVKKTTVAAKKSAPSKTAAKSTDNHKSKTKTAPPLKKSAKKLAPSSVKNFPDEREPIRVKAEIVGHEEEGSSPHLPSVRTSSGLTPVGDGLSNYLAGINKYPLLTRQQEQEIAERYYRDKNPKDAEILVTSNLRFVVKVAAEYSKFGNRLIDLIQEGNVGLMHAVKEFNPYKGARLITYAVWWIRGYIQEYLMRQHSVVRIGTTQNQRKLFYHLQKEKDKLDQLGQAPSLQLLSSRLGIPEEDIKMMEERMSGKDVSLDQPLSDSNSAPRMDMAASDELSVEDVLEKNETLSLLEEKISELRPSLSEKEIYILEKRLLSDNPITLQDIGSEWGVTREAVRQMESRLMNKIKQEMKKYETV